MYAGRTTALLITMVIFSTPASGDESSPGEILKKVTTAYKSLDTYKSEGTIISDIDSGVAKIKQETSFSILLKKPNLYLITWTQQGVMTQAGAVWSDGTQPYLYMSVLNAYSKMLSDEIALGGATGISGGAAFTVPSLFLSAFKDQPSPFARLIDPQLEQAEAINGEECYVISGSSAASKKETFWISKSTHLIRKYSRSLEAPEGGAIMPELTDEQLEETIKGLGQEVTEETKKNMKQMMERASAMTKTMKLKGLSTELQKNVSSPELDVTDFEFTPPKNATLKESLFGKDFGGSVIP